MPKKIIFFTTETDGLHQDRNSDLVIKKNLYKYAHLLKLSYHKTSYDKLLKKESFLVKPEHFFVDPKIEKINNLSQNKLDKKGVSLNKVLTTFKEDLKGVQVIVGHNLPFHIKTIQASCFREAVEIDFSNYLLIDLINFNHELEYPSLIKLSEHLFGEQYKNKSRNFNIILLKKIFFKLYEQIPKKD